MTIIPKRLSLQDIVPTEPPFEGNLRDFLPLRQIMEDGDEKAVYRMCGMLLGGKENRRALSGIEYIASGGFPDTAYKLLHWSDRFGLAADKLLAAYADFGERGFSAAQTALMRYYSERNDLQFLYWAQCAAPQSPEAQYLIARQYALAGNWEKALNWYNQAASQGWAQACLQLGKSFLYGCGVSADSAQAEVYLEYAAEHGWVEAQILLADLLAAKGNQDALSWYRLAAVQGNAAAQTALARQYLTGKLTDRDPLQAFKYARTAADRQFPDALCLMGDLCRYGLGIRPDLSAAQQYYRHAAALGSMAAVQKLLSEAALHQPEHYEKLKSEALQRQETEQLCRSAAACLDGIGQKKDYARARRLYLEAAVCNHADAAAGLGKIYYHGLGIPADAGSAAYWFGIAAEQNHPEAQYYSAFLLYHGQGTATNVPAAYDYLQAAADNGYGNPQELRAILEQWQCER